MEEKTITGKAKIFIVKVDDFMKRMRIMTASFIILVAVFLASGVALSATADPKAANPVTREMNSRLPQGLSGDDRQENEFASQGLIASDPALDICTANSKPSG